MREPRTLGDVYAWSWPSRPVGDGPYHVARPTVQATPPHPGRRGRASG